MNECADRCTCRFLATCWIIQTCRYYSKYETPKLTNILTANLINADGKPASILCLNPSCNHVVTMISMFSDTVNSFTADFSKSRGQRTEIIPFYLQADTQQHLLSLQEIESHKQEGVMFLKNAYHGVFDMAPQDLHSTVAAIRIKHGKQFRVEKLLSGVRSMSNL